MEDGAFDTHAIDDSADDTIAKHEEIVAELVNTPIPRSFDAIPHTRVAHIGLSILSWNVLVYLGAPPILFNLLHFLHNKLKAVAQSEWLLFIEVFQGIGQMVRVGLQRGIPSEGYDIKRDSLYQDILKAEGFVYLMMLCRRQALP